MKFCWRDLLVSSSIVFLSGRRENGGKSWYCVEQVMNNVSDPIAGSHGGTTRSESKPVCCEIGGSPLPAKKAGMIGGGESKTHLAAPARGIRRVEDVLLVMYAREQSHTKQYGSSSSLTLSISRLLQQVHVLVARSSGRQVSCAIMHSYCTWLTANPRKLVICISSELICLAHCFVALQASSRIWRDLV